MAPATGLHDGIAAANVPAHDGVGVFLAEEVDNLGVACGGSKHQGSLEVIVEGGEVGLVTEGDEQLDDREVAQRRGEVKVRGGEAVDRGVGVVQELWVRFDDALDEERVVGVDCSAQAEGRVDPVRVSAVSGSGLLLSQGGKRTC